MASVRIYKKNTLACLKANIIGQKSSKIKENFSTTSAHCNINAILSKDGRILVEFFSKNIFQGQRSGIRQNYCFLLLS